MNVLFLEQTKVMNTVHAIVIRHSFTWKPAIAKREPEGDNRGLYALCTWLDVWTRMYLESYRNNKCNRLSL